MANNQQIDDTQLQSILAEVEMELGKLAKSDLAKARPGENTESEDTSDASTTDPTGDNTSAAAESPDAASASPDGAGSDGPPPADDGSAPPPGADDGSAPVDDGSAAGADPSADPAGDQGPIDPQALMAEYAKLAPEDQKLHYMCLKQVLMQTLAGAGADPGAGAPGADAGAGSPPPPGADAGAGAPPPPAAAGSPPPDASAPAPALKAESGMSNDPKANGDLSKVTGGASLSKAEFDKAVEAAVAPLFKAVKHVLEAPLRKSVKSTADLGAPAPAAVDVSKMSREDIRSKLSEKLKAGTMTKSEKDLMIGFDTGKVTAVQIPAHLLK